MYLQPGDEEEDMDVVQEERKLPKKRPRMSFDSLNDDAAIKNLSAQEKRNRRHLMVSN